jgi:hypothetical protein
MADIGRRFGRAVFFAGLTGVTRSRRAAGVAVVGILASAVAARRKRPGRYLPASASSGILNPRMHSQTEASCDDLILGQCCPHRGLGGRRCRHRDDRPKVRHITARTSNEQPTERLGHRAAQGAACAPDGVPDRSRGKMEPRHDVPARHGSVPLNQQCLIRPGRTARAEPHRHPHVAHASRGMRGLRHRLAQARTGRIGWT